MVIGNLVMCVCLLNNYFDLLPQEVFFGVIKVSLL